MLRALALVILTGAGASGAFLVGRDSAWQSRYSAGHDAGWREGFLDSIRLHGDWMIARSGGRCIAFDPDNHRNAGAWMPSSDGRCHLSVFFSSGTD
jgi:hypothetical protein